MSRRAQALQRTAFWLIPAEPERGELQARIADLAAEHGTPVFEPHLSVHVGPTTTDVDLAALLRRVAAGLPALSLQAGPTVHSAERFRALAISFADPWPVRIQARLCAELGHSPSSYPLVPHLSLLYCADLDASRRETLASRHRFSGRVLRFDALAAVSPGPGKTDFTYVDHWDSSLRFALGGPARSA